MIELRLIELGFLLQKNLFRYHQITRQTTRQEVLLKEVKVNPINFK